MNTDFRVAMMRCVPKILKGPGSVDLGEEHCSENVEGEDGEDEVSSCNVHLSCNLSRLLIRFNYDFEYINS